MSSATHHELRAAEEHECVSRYVASGFWRSGVSLWGNDPHSLHALAPACSSGVSRDVSAGNPFMACAVLGQQTH